MLRSTGTVGGKLQNLAVGGTPALACFAHLKYNRRDENGTEWPRVEVRSESKQKAMLTKRIRTIVPNKAVVCDGTKWLLRCETRARI